MKKGIKRLPYLQAVIGMCTRWGLWMWAGPCRKGSHFEGILLATQHVFIWHVWQPSGFLFDCSW